MKTEHFRKGVKIFYRSKSNAATRTLKNWKVRLIEEEFMKQMWNGKGI